MSIAVVTTFANAHFPIYARQMLQSFVQYWPKEIPLMVQLDDDLLLRDVQKTTRPQDAIAVGWEKDHAAFVERNMGRDHPTDYRKQAVRFCHKVFAIKRAMDAVMIAREQKLPDAPRYLIWMDADVHTIRPVTLEDIKECLPKEGDAVAYLGRKDWPHSECGWLAFDLENGGEDYINSIVANYNSDHVFDMQQWHDSFVFDTVALHKAKATNLTADKPGMDIWPHSPMGKWSTHHKGPQAKATLAGDSGHRPIGSPQGQRVIVQTRNAIPHEEIRAHIAKNQTLIKNWVRPCKKTNEEIVVVSAGPMLIAEDVRKEAKAGRKIVAVKHALEPLKKAGIQPWACILLDPRPHVTDFIKDADPSVLWFVASQVNPAVTMELLARGCTVWGYHAAVGAGETELTSKQPYAIVSGGSATATRGLYMLGHMGFRRMRLYGYDLCVPDKPDLNAKDEIGQPKYMELSIGMNDPAFNLKRMFFSEPQLIAQFEELNEMIRSNVFKLQAFGDGIVPFLVKSNEVANLRNRELKAKMQGLKPLSYRELLDGAATGSAGKPATAYRPARAHGKHAAAANRRRARAS